MDLLDLVTHADGMESEVHWVQVHLERPLGSRESLHIVVDHSIEAVDHKDHMETGHNLHTGLDTGHYTLEAGGEEGYPIDLWEQ